MKRLLGSHGYLSVPLLDDDDILPSAGTIARRFGSLTKAYVAAGWEKSFGEIMVAAHSRRRSRSLREPPGD
jgi:hypothetical protein